MSMQDLDDMSKAVLEALWEYGGEATTTEIKEHTGFEGDGINSKLKYRREQHLEPGGLVETEMQDEGDTLPVTLWRLTEKGEKRVDQILGEDGTPPLSRRVEDLRTAVYELREQVETFEGRVDHVENAGTVGKIEEVEERVDALENQITETDYARQQRVDDLNLVVSTLAYLVALNDHQMSSRLEVYQLAEYAESKSNDYTRSELQVQPPKDVQTEWLRKGRSHVADHWESEEA